MNVGIIRKNILQLFVRFFSYILIPLLNSVPFFRNQIDFDITYFGIIRNQKKIIFKIMNAGNSIVLFRIIDINQKIMDKITLCIIQRTNL